MRIRFNVILEPEIYDSHRFAIKSLRLWHQQEKERKDQAETVQQRRDLFHRDIYLSGLFLHKLAPQLPAMLSQTLLLEKVNCQTLAQLTAMLNNLPTLQASPMADTDLTTQFSQLKQGQDKLMAQINALGRQLSPSPATAQVVTEGTSLAVIYRRPISSLTDR